MNRAEYMKELAYLLQDVPDEEKEETLQYYEDYFDDAGLENEEKVVVELGRPEKIAAIIREGAKNGYENQNAEYTETGYQNERYRGPRYEVVPPEGCKKRRLGSKDIIEEEEAEDNWEDASYQEVHEGMEDEGAYQSQYEHNDRYEYGGQYGQDSYDRGREKRSVNRRPRLFLWILAILGLIIAAPLLFSGAAVIFGAVVTVACAIGGIALAVILVAAVLLVTGVIFIGIGIAKLFSFPVAGIMLGGSGLVVFAVGMFFLWLAILVCGKAIPGIIHMIGNFFNFLSGKLRRGGAAA